MMAVYGTMLSTRLCQQAVITGRCFKRKMLKRAGANLRDARFCMERPIQTWGCKLRGLRGFRV